MGTRERQEILRSQYLFSCTCTPCSLPGQQDFQASLQALDAITIHRELSLEKLQKASGITILTHSVLYYLDNHKTYGKSV
jgi:hypothetical protein